MMNKYFILRLILLYKKIIIALSVILLILWMFYWNHSVLSTSNVLETANYASFVWRTPNASVNTDGSSIPRIIHQIWRSTEDIPLTFQPWMQSWIKLNEGYEYWFWSDEDMRKMIGAFFPQYLALYDNYPNQFYRADAFRYFLLYKYGGLYIDLDMECLKSISNKMDSVDCIVSQEPTEHAHFFTKIGPPLVSNAFMACRPMHPFFKYVIDNLSSYTGSFQWNDILHATGPYMLTNVYFGYHRGWFLGLGKPNEKVILAETIDFQPNPDDSMVDSMREMCRNADGQVFLSETFALRQKTLCDRLISHSFGRRADPLAYSDHHWTHTWAGKLHDPWGLHETRMRFSIHELMKTGKS